MKKKFRLVVDFSVEVEEEIEGQERENRYRLRSLLEAFLKNDQAILELYKLRLIGDLQGDEHIAAIEKSVVMKDEKGILKPVIQNLPAEDKQYYMSILNSNNNNLFGELDILFERFSALEFSKADFFEM
ncbi:hypothetical protein ACFLRB_00280 [Acidobacteriota bacterium]